MYDRVDISGTRGAEELCAWMTINKPGGNHSRRNMNLLWYLSRERYPTKCFVIVSNDNDNHNNKTHIYPCYLFIIIIISYSYYYYRYHCTVVRIYIFIGLLLKTCQNVIKCFFKTARCRSKRCYS